MKILRNKPFVSILSLFMFLGLIEVIFRLLSSSIILSFGFLRSLIIIFILSCLFGYITSLFKAKVMYALNLLLIVAACVYAFLQLGFYSFLGVYISINTSSQLGAVTEYIADFLKSVKISYLLIFTPAILYGVLAYILFSKGFDSLEKVSLKKRWKFSPLLILGSVLILLISSIYAFYLSLDDKYTDSMQVVSNKDLFWSVSNPGICVKEFGVTGFIFLDIKTIFYVKEDENININVDKQESVNRIIDDTAWNMLIKEEKNATLNKLNKYYINKEITDTNEYTGLFEGKNLIIIEMESVNDIINASERYFPNFTYLAKNGWYFENNYSPRNSCATGNNEFSAMTGLYSIYNNCTSNIYVDNTYFEAVFNLFNNKGYQTAGFHDYSESYYYRYKIEPNMGAQAYYNAPKLKMNYYKQYGEWASDAEFMEYYLDIINKNEEGKPFMSFITTVSGHQPYGSSYYGDYYYDITKDTKYSSTLRHYISKIKITDDALGILIDGLKEKGLFDDTVIVLFGDHYPYGLQLSVINEILDRPLTDYENEKVPLVIYNSSLEGKVFDTYTSYINLVPTLANLFNLEYDPRLYSGVDIFSSSYNNIVAFPDSSWKNDKAFYDAKTSKITYFDDEFKYSDEELKIINMDIYNRMNTASLAIKNNYFAYLDKNLNRIKESLKEEETFE